MKKIPSLFERNFDNERKVRDEVLPGSEWVSSGEGIATRKWDGVAVMVRDNMPFKRYDAKEGRTPPYNFEPAQSAPDPKSRHWPGWVPVRMPDDRWIFEGMAWGKEHLFGDGVIPNGTYEVCGPRIGTRHGANPERLDTHILVAHGSDVLNDCPRTFDGLCEYLHAREIEGIVWHHPDGRMVKIKKNDLPKPELGYQLEPACVN